MRPPVPATVNKAGANYKSEVAHLSYSPRRAYDEWLGICEGIRRHPNHLAAQRRVLPMRAFEQTGTAGGTSFCALPVHYENLQEC